MFSYDVKVDGMLNKLLLLQGKQYTIVNYT